MKLGTIKTKSSSRSYQREKEKRRGKRVKRFKYKVTEINIILSGEHIMQYKDDELLNHTPENCIILLTIVAPINLIKIIKSMNQLSVITSFTDFSVPT